MIKIYVAAYKNFNDYKTLKKVYDYFLSKQNKENVLFYATTGEHGDNLCMKYIRENGYNYVDWLPQKWNKNRAKEKEPFIADSDHVILITDGNSIGIGVALNYAVKYISRKIVQVRMQCGDLLVFTRERFKKKKEPKKILLNEL